MKIAAQHIPLGQTGWGYQTAITTSIRLFYTSSKGLIKLFDYKKKKNNINWQGTEQAEAQKAAAKILHELKSKLPNPKQHKSTQI